jgi:hypothetical protein
MRKPTGKAMKIREAPGVDVIKETVAATLVAPETGRPSTRSLVIVLPIDVGGAAAE